MSATSNNHRLNTLAAQCLAPVSPVGAADLYADASKCCLCHGPMLPGEPKCPTLLAHDRCSLDEFQAYLNDPGMYDDYATDYSDPFPSDEQLVADEAF